MQLVKPILKLYMSIGLGTTSRPSNSFQTKASKAYLIGDKYCSQPYQAGKEPELARKPPNMFMGIMTKPDSIEAVSDLSNRLENK